MRETASQSPSVQQNADAHVLSGLRFYNVMCTACGEYVEPFGNVVKEGYLSQSRAEGCGDECRQVEFAFETPVLPYIDSAVRKGVRPAKPIPPDA